MIWRASAASALDRIVSYIADRNPRAAEKIYAQVRAAADSLLLSPRRNRDRGKGLRIHRVGRTPYLIHYAVEQHAEGEDIFVVDVRHGARRPVWPL